MGKYAWWSTPLIIVIYIGFFVFAAVLALCIRRYRDRRLQLSDENIPRAPGLDASEIESLPSLRFAEIKMYSVEKGDKLQIECSVCLNEFKDQEVLRILPDCFHVFHID